MSKIAYQLTIELEAPEESCQGNDSTLAFFFREIESEARTRAKLFKFDVHECNWERLSSSKQQQIQQS
tara:strand:+ start:66 stop:269 length:204 start_codon:yes stop_codon:yes gene_type:complete